MIKLVTILLLLSTLTLSKYVVNQQPAFVGGYQPIDLDNANANADRETYREVQSIVDFARTQYKKEGNAEPLGKLVSVSRQLVAGFNYKLVFENDG